MAANGAIALLFDGARVLVYGAMGLSLGRELLYALVFCVPISFVGAKLGELAVRYLPQKQFRYLVEGFVVLMGIKLFFKI